MTRYIVGLGSNLGARAAYLAAAVALLEASPDLVVEARSNVVSSPAMTQPQPDFLNAAIRLRTPRAPEALLDLLLETEQKLGRERRERWGARTIDLDLLWITGDTVHTPRLEVPHPGLFSRNFALFPLLDVLDPRDPACGALNAGALLFERPSTLGTLGEIPPVRITFDTVDEITLDFAALSDRADMTARLLQVALELLPGRADFAGVSTGLGSLETAPDLLLARALEQRAARTLVSPSGEVSALGTRSTDRPDELSTELPQIAMFVLSPSPLYDSTGDAPRLRVRRTGAHG